MPRLVEEKDRIDKKSTSFILFVIINIIIFLTYIFLAAVNTAMRNPGVEYSIVLVKFVDNLLVYIFFVGLIESIWLFVYSFIVRRKYKLKNKADSIFVFAVTIFIANLVMWGVVKFMSEALCC